MIALYAEKSGFTHYDLDKWGHAYPFPCVSRPVTHGSQNICPAAHVRETFKEGTQRHVNDATNDLMEDLTVFEPTAANVSAFVGHTAYLPCRVRNLGDKVRRKKKKNGTKG
ncbi:hypothetical protein EAG_05325 [Camponotus floridanus]|uniref:Uncharacterized protein n=1 Tax=Camponotus floridanus TaxID=104421 RepID=E2A066_CAMFO|nr:hypothetical protein EAG_05325 [Camponotus floridanus]